jgi:hypothetical protein
VALARTGVSQERVASIIRVTRISELRTTLAVISYMCLSLMVTTRLVHSLLSNFLSP